MTREEKDRVIARLRRGWCQGVNALDAFGWRLGNGADPTAVQWCVTGACQSEQVPMPQSLGGATPVAFNDTIATSVDEVIAALEAEPCDKNR